MNTATETAGGLTLSALQRIILQMYGEKDAARGDAATFLWLTEEFGELATALRRGIARRVGCRDGGRPGLAGDPGQHPGHQPGGGGLEEVWPGVPRLRGGALRLRPGRKAVNVAIPEGSVRITIDEVSPWA